MYSLFILLLVFKSVAANRRSDPIQFLNSHVDKSDFPRAYQSVKSSVRRQISNLLNTRDNEVLLSKILKEDLEYLSSSSFFPKILEYIQDKEVTALIHKQIFKNENNQLQTITNSATKRVIGQLFYNAFKIKNSKALEVLKNRLSGVQINLLFHDIIESWDIEAKLDVFRNLSKYFTPEKLINSLSNDVLVILYEYGLQNDDYWLDILSFDKVRQKITDFMTLGMAVWEPKTIMHFIKHGLRIWDGFDNVSKINFFYDAILWDPAFILLDLYKF